MLHELAPQIGPSLPADELRHLDPGGLVELAGFKQRRECIDGGGIARGHRDIGEDSRDLEIRCIVLHAQTAIRIQAPLQRHAGSRGVRRAMPSGLNADDAPRLWGEGPG